MLCFICEILIRVVHLVPDIPERYIDDSGIQKYKVAQSGYYTSAKEKWNVNKYGWLGTHQVIEGKTITIIGDSYIENLMNPISCHQGSILKEYNPNFAFFEAGRSGVTFIEALIISKNLCKEIKPKLQLLYVSENDFYESITEYKKYNDRVQLSLNKKEIVLPSIQSSFVKKILYNTKFIYYLYLEYPILIKEQNKGTSRASANSKNSLTNKKELINRLLKYSTKNYNFDNVILVFHPNTSNYLIDIVKDFGIQTISLDASSTKTWSISDQDKHWSCYGHNEAGKQVSQRLLSLYSN